MSPLFLRGGSDEHVRSFVAVGQFHRETKAASCRRSPKPMDGVPSTTRRCTPDDGQRDDRAKSLEENPMNNTRRFEIEASIPRGESCAGKDSNPIAPVRFTSLSQYTTPPTP